MYTANRFKQFELNYGLAIIQNINLDIKVRYLVRQISHKQETKEKLVWFLQKHSTT